MKNSGRKSSRSGEMTALGYRNENSVNYVTRSPTVLIQLCGLFPLTGESFLHPEPMISWRIWVSFLGSSIDFRRRIELFIISPVRKSKTHTMMRVLKSDLLAGHLLDTLVTRILPCRHLV